MATARIPYFKAWFIFYLASTLTALGVGMAVGFVVGAILGIAGVEIVMIQRICGGLGLILGFVVSYFIFRWVIDRFVVPAISTPQA